MQPPVQLSQMAQCLNELFVRCSDPLKSRMNMYLAGSCLWSASAQQFNIQAGTYMGYNGYSHEESRQC